MSKEESREDGDKELMILMEEKRRQEKDKNVEARKKMDYGKGFKIEKRLKRGREDRKWENTEVDVL